MRTQNLLKPYNIDVIFLIGYMKIVSNVLVNEYKNKIFNIHPSLLPKYGGPGFYGIKVHEEVIRSKDKSSLD